jgi:putative transposase
MDLKEGKNSGTGFPACAQEAEVSIRHRYLPHWQLAGSTYFIAFRLKSGIMADDERRIVLNAINYFHNERYLITSAVVMPDHVHLILKPIISKNNIEYSLSKILQGIKGFTARIINKSRGNRGALWQDESFDRIIRDYDEYLEKWNYIRGNPVKAGLCSSPENYEFLWEPDDPEE